MLLLILYQSGNRALSAATLEDWLEMFALDTFFWAADGFTDPQSAFEELYPARRIGQTALTGVESARTA